MTDFSVINATDINDSLNKLSEKDNNALIKDLEHEISASDIKLDKQVLVKTQTTFLTPIKNQRAFTSRASYEKTPEAKLTAYYTPTRRIQESGNKKIHQLIVLKAPNYSEHQLQ